MLTLSSSSRRCHRRRVLSIEYTEEFTTDRAIALLQVILDWWRGSPTGLCFLPCFHAQQSKLTCIERDSANDVGTTHNLICSPFSYITLTTHPEPQDFIAFFLFLPHQCAHSPEEKLCLYNTLIITNKKGEEWENTVWNRQKKCYLSVKRVHKYKKQETIACVEYGNNCKKGNNARYTEINTRKSYWRVYVHNRHASASILTRDVGSLSTKIMTIPWLERPRVYKERQKRTPYTR